MPGTWRAWRRLHGLVVDSAEPQAQARWWVGVYGVSVIGNDGRFTLEGVPGMPILTMNFVPVPEPKTVKNRIHCDVTVAAVRPLVGAGATVLREPGGDIRWHVPTDPEGTTSARVSHRGYERVPGGGCRVGQVKRHRALEVR